ncbi:phosphoribosylaminoimidazolesuccinocarboxamide synthase [Halococcoides cellulosivorans]|uniref:phosphoribosylaminoimidazolesuccinocarboxamide synthase n=1 Tax=Halococcoides cellulosivorans TaxID=1679096 RepID=A0A2R4X204_9EURY|nr:phosphoribosylaminoimidazolesuccinocarboxamide synthase [Halococcoides cellulosivorans]AWB27811.1 phosphoribosylaminoimidazolesuccinocarboxamide synthase [Halococcoides cellulosivorans]
MTSVKSVRIDREPSADGLGRGAFLFSDAYSVFDWGEMPDAIPGKGASLCTMGASNFEHLEHEGVPTHYLGVGPDAVPLADALDAGRAPTEMALQIARVPDLPFADGSYDYSAFHDAAGEQFVVPLEIVFRRTVPPGSSLRSRTDPADHGLDVANWPDETVVLPEPVVEFSTKYEEQDRYLDRSEADRIAGPASIDVLEQRAREVEAVVTDQAEQAGWTHADGKIECVYSGGDVLVADVAGTFDENRFLADGVQLSKEFLRQHYRRTQPAWVEAVKTAKDEAAERGVADWRSLCDVDPDPLPADLRDLASDLYRGGANAYCDRSIFDAPPIEGTIDTIAEL